MLSLSDDGSVNWPRTLRLARHASDDGIAQAVVSTTVAGVDVLCSRMPHLLGLLKQHAIPLRVAPALELSMRFDLFEQAIHVSTIVGGLHRRYVLLRVPGDSGLPIVPVVESLRRMNLTTILLAPERCDRFRRDDSELKKIVRSGALVQLSAASLTDQTDRHRASLCKSWIRSGLCHFVATESGRHHDLPISLSEAHRLVFKWAGRTVADALCCHNPLRLFDGEGIRAAPRPKSRLSFFSRAA